jgi:hypothetical protein
MLVALRLLLCLIERMSEVERVVGLHLGLVEGKRPAEAKVLFGAQIRLEGPSLSRRRGEGPRGLLLFPLDRRAADGSLAPGSHRRQLLRLLHEDPLDQVSAMIIKLPLLVLFEDAVDLEHLRELD